MKHSGKNVRMSFTRLELVEMGESQTSLMDLFEALYSRDNRFVTPNKGYFCLSMSTGNGPCLLVKL